MSKKLTKVSIALFVSAVCCVVSYIATKNAMNAPELSALELWWGATAALAYFGWIISTFATPFIYFED